MLSSSAVQTSLGSVAREIGLYAIDHRFRIGEIAAKAIGVMQGADIGVDAAFSTATAAWFGALGSRQGMFFQMLRRGLAIQVPLYSAIGVASGYLPGSDHGEARAAVLSRMTFSHERLQPSISMGLAAVTRELVQAGGAGATQAIEDAASLGVIFSIDGDIYNEVSGSAYPGQTASGSTAVDASRDARGALLSVFEPGQPTSRGFWVCSPRVAIALATCTTTGGLLAFPDMRPDGGSLLGLVVLVSPAWGDALTLFDGAQIAAGADSLGVTASLQASFSAALSPTQNAALANGPEALVSAWQTGAIVYRTMTHYTFALARESAAFTIGGASAYGEA